MENLQEFAKEINKTWSSDYKAEVKKNKLYILKEDKTIQSGWDTCAEMGIDLNISGYDNDAIDQLGYMVRR